MLTNYKIYTLETFTGGAWMKQAGPHILPEVPVLLARALRRRGHECRVLVWDEPRELPEEEWPEDA